MKRYLLFAYCEYYPSGGMNDFVSDFDNLEEAKSSIIEKDNCYYMPSFLADDYDCDHVHIYDSVNRENVYVLSNRDED